MESDDLKAPPSEDAQLDALLRTQSHWAPLPDEDFSRRVLAALPRPTARRRFPARAVAVFAGTLLGAAPAAGQFAGEPVLGAMLRSALERMSHPAIGLALGVTVLSLLFVFWRDLRRFLPL